MPYILKNTCTTIIVSLVLMILAIIFFMIWTGMIRVKL